MVVAEAMKFCADCRWCSSKPGFFTRKISQFARCGNPKAGEGNRYFLVTGHSSDSDEYCATQRGCEHLCGLEAKWFESRSTQPRN